MNSDVHFDAENGGRFAHELRGVLGVQERRVRCGAVGKQNHARDRRRVRVFDVKKLELFPAPPCRVVHDE